MSPTKTFNIKNYQITAYVDNAHCMGTAQCENEPQLNEYLIKHIKEQTFDSESKYRSVLEAAVAEYEKNK